MHANVRTWKGGYWHTDASGRGILGRPWCARCGRPVDNWTQEMVRTGPGKADVLLRAFCHGRIQQVRFRLVDWQAATLFEVGAAFLDECPEAADPLRSPFPAPGGTYASGAGTAMGRAWAEACARDYAERTSSSGQARAPMWPWSDVRATAVDGFNFREWNEVPDAR